MMYGGIIMNWQVDLANSTEYRTCVQLVPVTFAFIRKNTVYAQNSCVASSYTRKIRGALVNCLLVFLPMKTVQSVQCRLWLTDQWTRLEYLSSNFKCTSSSVLFT